jgi:hypothetical protein
VTTEDDARSLLPPAFDVPADQRGEASLPLRYEDVTQDGRLVCRAMTHAIGPTIWEKVLLAHPITPPLQADGIVPILSRLAVVSVGKPIAFGPRPKTRGGFAMVRALDAKGRARFRLDMAVSVDGVVGRTHPPRLPNAGTPIVLGHIHAEHVLTRPFGAPDQRRVDALPSGVLANGGDAVWRDAESSLDLPAGARWLDADFGRDANVLVFGLGHTDSNQHVNSLVYPLALEEAALRHAQRPVTARFCHHFELAFKKPFFEGERMRIELRAYARGAAFGVVARCVNDASGEPHTFGRLELVP